MMSHLSRRFFSRTLAASLLSVPFIKRARAATALEVGDWGSPWIEYSKELAGKWGKSDIDWILHSGGAASILPKIKATWPNPPYDLVDVWGPVFNSLINEGWAATVTAKDVPNITQIPDALFTKDKQGNIKNIPRGVGGDFWTYRTDKCPIKITKADDLLDKRLKGQILWPNPTLNTNVQVIALAFARGGDEHNLEPGWEFLKEIAKAGNIGRISANSSDVINSLTTGETTVTYVDQGTLSGIKGIPFTYLTKTDPSLKTFMFVTGWAVLESSKNKDLAFDFANFAVSKENNESYSKALGEAPANSSSTSSVEHLKFAKDDFGKFAINPDYEKISSQVDEWNKRFEKEIVPLL